MEHPEGCRADRTVERTRDEVVRILHEQGASSVAELARVIGVSEGSVRRHMDILVAEGLLDTRLDRQPRGRPMVRYSLSEAGEERSAFAHHSRLLDRLYPALAALPAEQVSGLGGEQLLELVFHQLAEDIAREHAPRVQGVQGEALKERIARVADVLSEEGILNEVVDEGDAFRLRNVGCPYRSTAEGTHAACGADRQVIELLLGESVEQLSTIVDGAPTCEYIVKKREAAGAAVMPAPRVAN